MERLMSLNCSAELPRSVEFYDGLTGVERGLTIACAVLSFIDVLILFYNAYYIWRWHTSVKEAKVVSIWQVGLCPILAVVSLMAVVVPNAILYCDVVIAGAISIVLYKFLGLLTTYLHYSDGLRDQITQTEIRFDVLPCCCICACLPKGKFKKSTITVLRALILQHLFITLTITFSSMVIWLDKNYNLEELRVINVYLYMTALRNVSMVVAFYAISILVTICQDVMKPYYVREKFLVLTLCILFFNLQDHIFKLMSIYGVFDFRGCFAGSMMSHYYKNLTFCVEMTLLTLLNLWFYHRPLALQSKVEEPSDQVDHGNAGTNNMERIKPAAQFIKVQPCFHSRYQQQPE